MYLKDLARSLARRWYLLPFGLAIVVGMSVAAYRAVPPDHEARATVLLLPPDSSLEAGDNPFLALGGLRQPLEVLRQVLDSGDARTAILQEFPSSKYVVAEDMTTNSPILLVVAVGPSNADAMGTLRAVLDATSSTLEDVQERLDVPERAQVKSVELTVDRRSQEEDSTRVQVLIAVAGVSATATVLLIGTIDGLLLARVRTKRESNPADDDRLGDEERS